MLHFYQSCSYEDLFLSACKTDRMGRYFCSLHKESNMHTLYSTVCSTHVNRALVRRETIVHNNYTVNNLSDSSVLEMLEWITSSSINEWSTLVCFSNGLLDPWSGAGVLTNISSTVIAVVIPEGAHHLDLRAANEDDPQSVIDARKFYELTFSKWIFEFQAKELKRQETHRKLRSFQQKQQSNKVDNEISRFLQEERKLTKSVKKTATVQRKYAKDVRKHSNLGMFHPRSVMLAMNSHRDRPKSPKAIENDYYVYKYGLRSLS